MKEESKWMVRAAIAIMCIVTILIYSGFALFEEIDTVLFWKIFTALSVYPWWFFISRQVEKGK